MRKIILGIAILLCPLFLVAQSLEKESHVRSGEKRGAEGSIEKSGASTIMNRRIEVTRELGDFGPGKASLYAERQGQANAAADGGTSFLLSGIDAAIVGFTDWASNYTTAIAAYSFLDFENSSALVASNNNGSVRAHLAHKDENDVLWSAYFNNKVRLEDDLDMDGDLLLTGEIDLDGDLFMDGELKLEALAGTGERSLSVASDGTLMVATPPAPVAKTMVLGMAEMIPVDVHDDPYLVNSGGARYDGGSGTILIPISLPVDTKVTKVEIQYLKNTTLADLNMKLVEYSHNGSLTPTTKFDFTATIAQGVYVVYTYSTAFTLLDDSYYQVEIQAANGTWQANTRVKSVRLTYESVSYTHLTLPTICSV